MNEVTLKKRIQKKLGVPIDSLFSKIDQSYHSVIDLYDPQTFNTLMFKCVPPQTKSKLLIRFPQSTTAVTEFQTNWEMLVQASKINHLNASLMNPWPSPQNLIALEHNPQQGTIDQMCRLLQILFQVMLKNENVIYIITEMQENDQVKIKDYIEGMSCIEHQPSPTIDVQSPTTLKFKPWEQRREGEFNHEIIDRIQQLEQLAISKDQQLSRIKQKLTKTEQQLAQKSQLLESKQEEIEMLNRRISIYSQTDSLFEEKDEQIAKLHSQLTDIKLKFHLKTTELNNEMGRIKEQSKYYEEQKNQISLQFDRMNNKYEILMLQKQQGDTANKRVISNLKQKIKNLNQRLNEQQKNIMEILMEKELKDKEIYELEKQINPMEANNRRVKKQQSYQQFIKTSGRKSTILGDELGGFLQQNGADSGFKQYFDILFGISEDRCSGELCIALRAEYVRIVHQMLKINNQLDSINYFSQQNRMQCVEDQLKRISQTYHENMKLKQKIILLQQSDKGHPSKETREQMNKLKKKIVILKRKIEEADSQKRQELQILVSAFSESIKML